MGKEEDILGMNGNMKKNIDNVPAPFKKKSKKIEDDFDDWGFGDDDDENKNKKQKPMIKEVVNITDDVIDGNNGKKKVESLLDFNDNKKNNTKKNDNFDPLMDLDDIDDGDVNGKKVKDGNSSDELDAFFDEMA